MEDIMNNIENDNIFFGREEEGIFLPENNHVSQEDLEKIMKRKFLIKSPGIIHEKNPRGICYDEKENKKIPFSFNYQLVTDNFVWECKDIRKAVINSAINDEDELFTKTINLALSNVAKYITFNGYDFNTSKKVNKDFLYVTLDELILKEKFTCKSVSKKKCHKPPIKITERESISIQKIMSGEITPKTLKLEAPKSSYDNFISGMLPDDSEPSTIEGEFFQEREK